MCFLAVFIHFLQLCTMFTEAKVCPSISFFLFCVAQDPDL